MGVFRLTWRMWIEVDTIWVWRFTLQTFTALVRLVEQKASDYIYTLVVYFFTSLALQHLLPLELVVYGNDYVKQFYFKTCF